MSDRWKTGTLAIAAGFEIVPGCATQEGRVTAVNDTDTYNTSARTWPIPLQGAVPNFADGPTLGALKEQTRHAWGEPLLVSDVRHGPLGPLWVVRAPTGHRVTYNEEFDSEAAAWVDALRLAYKHKRPATCGLPDCDGVACGERDPRAWSR